TTNTSTLSLHDALPILIGDESNTELLRSALSSVIGGTWRVTVELAGAPAADPTPHEPQPEPDPRDDSGPANPSNSVAAELLGFRSEEHTSELQSRGHLE